MFLFPSKYLAAALMALCLLCALAVPRTAVSGFDASLAVLFEPVSIPSRVIAMHVLSRSKSAGPVDARPDVDVKTENEQLRQDVIYLNQQLAVLKQINQDRAAIGKLRDFCTPVEVIAGDSGVRDTLSLDAGSGVIRKGMPVVYPGGLVGRIDAAGPASSRVRLVTDKGMRLQANIVRYIPGENGKPVAAQLKIPDPMVEGAGGGTMVIHNLTRKDAIDDFHLVPGDLVILHDSDWPAPVWGTPIGRIVSVVPWRDAALYAEIILVPSGPLDQLREVQVLTKE